MEEIKQNLKNMIAKHCAETGEEVISFIIGQAQFPSNGFGLPDDKIGKLLTADELPLLDCETGLCYGNPVYIWTDKSVLFFEQWATEVSLASIPRNPVVCEPEKFGSD